MSCSFYPNENTKLSQRYNTANDIQLEYNVSALKCSEIQVRDTAEIDFFVVAKFIWTWSAKCKTYVLKRFMKIRCMILGSHTRIIYDFFVNIYAFLVVIQDRARN